MAVGQDVTVLAEDDSRSLTVVNRFRVAPELPAFLELVLEALAQLRHQVEERIVVVARLAVIRLVGNPDDHDGRRSLVRHLDEGLVELSRQIYCGRSFPRGQRKRRQRRGSQQGKKTDVRLD